MTGFCQCESSLCDHDGGCARSPEAGTRGVDMLGVGTTCTPCTDHYHAAGYGYHDDGQEVNGVW